MQTTKIDSQIDNLPNAPALLKVKVPTKREAHALYWRFRDAKYSHLAAVIAVHTLHNDGMDTLEAAKKGDRQFAEHVNQFRDQFEFLASNIPTEDATPPSDDQLNDLLRDESDDSTVPRS